MLPAARRNALRRQEYQQRISDDTRDENPGPNVGEIENILAHEQRWISRVEVHNATVHATRIDRLSGFCVSELLFYLALQNEQTIAVNKRDRDRKQSGNKSDDESRL